MSDRAVLQSAEQDRRITQAQDGMFLYTFQRAVLLALKESGQLSEQQYRHAEEMLKEQQGAAQSGTVSGR